MTEIADRLNDRLDKDAEAIAADIFARSRITATTRMKLAARLERILAREKAITQTTQRRLT